MRSQTTPLSWSLFGIPWCLEDRSSPRRSSERTAIENSNHSSALPCPLSENHVILTHQFTSCDIIESDTVTVTSKWHRLCDDCRLMLMFVCPAHLFVLVLRSNSSQNHMKNPGASEHICDTPVIASAQEGWYYLNYVLSPTSSELICIDLFA